MPAPEPIDPGEQVRRTERAVADAADLAIVLPNAWRLEASPTPWLRQAMASTSTARETPPPGAVVRSTWWRAGGDAAAALAALRTSPPGGGRLDSHGPHATPNGQAWEVTFVQDDGRPERAPVRSQLLIEPTRGGGVVIAARAWSWTRPERSAGTLLDAPVELVTTVNALSQARPGELWPGYLTGLSAQALVDAFNRVPTTSLPPRACPPDYGAPQVVRFALRTRVDRPP